MKKAFTLIELLVCIAILAILLSVAGAAIGGCSVSKGSRVGIVSKLSYKGNVFKSWEGELMLGRGESSNTWEFSVRNDKIVESIKEAMRSGSRVELEYTQMRVAIKTSTPYDITAIKVLPTPPAPPVMKVE